SAGGGGFRQGGSVDVLLGKGDGTFTARHSYPAAVGPAAVALGDFNGDGKLDLAVANTGGNNISVLLGQGSGTFAAAPDDPVGSFAKAVAVGGFNGDGIPHLAGVEAGAAGRVQGWGRIMLVSGG